MGAFQQAVRLWISIWWVCSADSRCKQLGDCRRSPTSVPSAFVKPTAIHLESRGQVIVFKQEVTNGCNHCRLLTLRGGGKPIPTKRGDHGSFTSTNKTVSPQSRKKGFLLHTTPNQKPLIRQGDHGEAPVTSQQKKWKNTIPKKSRATLSRPSSPTQGQSPKQDAFPLKKTRTEKDPQKDPQKDSQKSIHTNSKKSTFLKPVPHKRDPGDSREQSRRNPAAQPAKKKRGSDSEHEGQAARTSSGSGKHNRHTAPCDALAP